MADSIIPLSIEITANSGTANGELKKFQSGLDGVTSSSTDTNKSLDKTASELQQSGDEAKKATGNFEYFSGLLKDVSSNNMDIQATAQALGQMAQQLNNLGFDFSTSIQAFNDFSQKIKEVSTLTGDTSGIPLLTEQVKELAVTFGKDAVTQAAALYQTISAGITDSKDAIIVLTEANKLAVGGATDVFTAVDGLTSLMNAYGIKASGVAEITDGLFTTMKMGKTTIKELSDSIGNISGIAAQSGLSLNDLNAAIATITLSGKSTAEATTALKNVLTSLLQPTKEAADLAEQLGIEYNIAAIRGGKLGEFLADVAEKTGNNSTLIATLFGNIRGLGGVMSLSGASAETFANILGKLENKAGASDEALSKMSVSLQASTERLDTAWSNISLGIGTNLEPTLIKFNDALSSFVNNNQGMVTAITITGATIAGVLGGMSGLALGLMGIGTAAKFVTTAIADKAATIRAAAAADLLSQQQSVATTAALVEQAYATANLAAIKKADLVNDNNSFITKQQNIILSARANAIDAEGVIAKAAATKAELAKVEASSLAAAAENRKAVSTAYASGNTSLATAISGAYVKTLQDEAIKYTQAATAASNHAAILAADTTATKASVTAATQSAAALEAQALAARTAAANAVTHAATMEADAAATTTATVAHGRMSGAMATVGTGLGNVVTVLKGYVGTTGLVVAGLAALSYAAYSLSPTIDTTTKSLKELQDQMANVASGLKATSFSVATDQIKELTNELNNAIETKANMDTMWGRLFYDPADIDNIDQKIGILTGTMNLLSQRQQEVGDTTEATATRLKNAIADIKSAILAANQSQWSWSVFNQHDDQVAGSLMIQLSKLQKQLKDLETVSKDAQYQQDALASAYNKVTNKVNLNVDAIESEIAVTKAINDADKSRITTATALAELQGDEAAVLNAKAQAANNVYNASIKLADAYQREADEAAVNLQALQNYISKVSPEFAKTLQIELAEKTKAVAITRAKADATRDEAQAAEIAAAKADLAASTYGNQSNKLQALTAELRNAQTTQTETAGAVDSHRVAVTSLTARLQEAEQQQATTQANLNRLKTTLADAEKQYKSTGGTVESLTEQLKSQKIALDAKKQSVNDDTQALNDNAQNLEKGKQKLDDANTSLEQSRISYTNNTNAIQDSIDKYNEHKDALNQANTQYTDASNAVDKLTAQQALAQDNYDKSTAAVKLSREAGEQLNQQIAAEEQAIADLNSQLELSTTKQAEQQSEIDSHVAKLEGLNNQYKTLPATLSLLGAKSEEYRQALKAIEDEQSNAGGTTVALAAKHDLAVQAYNRSVDAVLAATEELDRYQAVISNEEQTIESLRAGMDNLTTSRADQSKQLGDHIVGLQSLKSQYEDLLNKITLLNTGSNKYSQGIDSANINLLVAQTRVNELTEAHKKATENLKLSDDAVKLAQDNVQKYTNGIQQEQDVIAKLRNEMDNTTTSHTALQEKINQHVTALNHLQTIYNNLPNSVTQLSIANVQFKQDLDNANVSLQKAKDKLNQATEAQQAAVTQHKELLNTYQQLSNESENYRSQIENEKQAITNLTNQNGWLIQSHTEQQTALKAHQDNLVKLQAAYTDTSTRLALANEALKGVTKATNDVNAANTQNANIVNNVLIPARQAAADQTKQLTQAEKDYLEAKLKVITLTKQIADAIQDDIANSIRLTTVLKAQNENIKAQNELNIAVAKTTVDLIDDKTALQAATEANITTSSKEIAQYVETLVKQHQAIDAYNAEAEARGGMTPEIEKSIQAKELEIAATEKSIITSTQYNLEQKAALNNIIILNADKVASIERDIIATEKQILTNKNSTAVTKINNDQAIELAKSTIGLADDRLALIQATESNISITQTEIQTNGSLLALQKAYIETLKSEAEAHGGITPEIKKNIDEKEKEIATNESGIASSAKYLLEQQNSLRNLLVLSSERVGSLDTEIDRINKQIVATKTHNDILKLESDNTIALTKNTETLIDDRAATVKATELNIFIAKTELDQYVELLDKQQQSLAATKNEAAARGELTPEIQKSIESKQADVDATEKTIASTKLFITEQSTALATAAVLSNQRVENALREIEAINKQLVANDAKNAITVAENEALTALAKTTQSLVDDRDAERQTIESNISAITTEISIRGNLLTSQNNVLQGYKDESATRGIITTEIQKLIDNKKEEIATNESAIAVLKAQQVEQTAALNNFTVMNASTVFGYTQTIDAINKHIDAIKVKNELANLEYAVNMEVAKSTVTLMDDRALERAALQTNIQATQDEIEQRRLSTSLLQTYILNLESEAKAHGGITPAIKEVIDTKQKDLDANNKAIVSLQQLAAEQRNMVNNSVLYNQVTQAILEEIDALEKQANINKIANDYSILTNEINVTLASTTAQLTDDRIAGIAATEATIAGLQSELDQHLPLLQAKQNYIDKAREEANILGLITPEIKKKIEETEKEIEVHNRSIGALTIKITKEQESLANQKVISVSKEDDIRVTNQQIIANKASNDIVIAGAAYMVALAKSTKELTDDKLAQANAIQVNINALQSEQDGYVELQAKQQASLDAIKQQVEIEGVLTPLMQNLIENKTRDINATVLQIINTQTQIVEQKTLLDSVQLTIKLNTEATDLMVKQIDILKAKNEAMRAESSLLATIAANTANLNDDNLVDIAIANQNIALASKELQVYNDLLLLQKADIETMKAAAIAKGDTTTETQNLINTKEKELAITVRNIATNQQYIEQQKADLINSSVLSKSRQDQIGVITQQLEATKNLNLAGNAANEIEKAISASTTKLTDDRKAAKVEVENNLVNANIELQINSKLLDQQKLALAAMKAEANIHGELTPAVKSLIDTKEKDIITTEKNITASQQFIIEQKILLANSQELPSVFTSGTASINEQSQQLSILASKSKEAAKNVAELELAQKIGAAATVNLTEAQGKLDVVTKALSNTQGMDQATINKLIGEQDKYQSQVFDLINVIDKGKKAESELTDARIAAAAAAKQVEKAAQAEQENINNLSEDIGRNTGIREKQSDIIVSGLEHKADMLEMQAEELKKSGDYEGAIKLETEALGLRQEAADKEYSASMASANAKQQQADLAYKAADAKYAEAMADGEYTIAEKASVEAMRDSAASLQVEADALAANAKQTKETTDATLKQKAATLQGIESIDGMRKAVENVDEVTRGFAEGQDKLMNSIGDYSKTAMEAAWASQKLGGDIDNLASSAAYFVGLDSKSQLSQEIESLNKQINTLNNDIQNSSKNSLFVNDILRAMTDAEVSVMNYKKSVMDAVLQQKEMELATENLGKSMDNLSGEFDRGELTSDQYMVKLQQLASEYQGLGDEKLQDLRDAIRELEKSQLDDKVTAISAEFDKGNMSIEEYRNHLLALKSNFSDLSETDLQSLLDALDKADQSIQDMGNTVNDALVGALKDADGVLGEYSLEIEEMQYQQLMAELEIQRIQAEGHADIIARIDRIIDIRQNLHERNVKQIEDENKAAGVSPTYDTAPIENAHKAYRKVVDVGVEARDTFYAVAGAMDKTAQAAVGATQSLGGVTGAMDSVSASAGSTGIGLHTITTKLDDNTNSANKTIDAFNGVANAAQHVHDITDNIAKSGLKTSQQWLDVNTDSATQTTNGYYATAEAAQYLHDTTDDIAKSGLKTSQQWLDINTVSATNTADSFKSVANQSENVHDTTNKIGASGLKTSKELLDANTASANATAKAFSSIKSPQFKSNKTSFNAASPNQSTKQNTQSETIAQSSKQDNQSSLIQSQIDKTKLQVELTKALADLEKAKNDIIIDKAKTATDLAKSANDLVVDKAKSDADLAKSANDIAIDKAKTATDLAKSANDLVVDKAKTDADLAKSANDLVVDKAKTDADLAKSANDIAIDKAKTATDLAKSANDLVVDKAKSDADLAKSANDIAIDKAKTATDLAKSANDIAIDKAKTATDLAKSANDLAVDDIQTKTSSIKAEDDIAVDKAKTAADLARAKVDELKYKLEAADYQSKLDQITKPAKNSGLNDNQTVVKVFKLELSLGGRTVTMYGKDTDSNTLDSLLSGLESSKNVTASTTR